MKLAVLGAGGRMGQLICQAIDASDDHLVARVDRGGDATVPVGHGCFADADVVIDFSLPEGLRAAVPHLGDAALVSGTTGLNDEDEALLNAQAARAPVLHAANFSVGITALVDVVERLSAALPDYQVEIIEAHHQHKRDAPSGTALRLGRSVAEARGLKLSTVAQHGREGADASRSSDQIGFHSLRGGEIRGEHQVWLIGPDERIELRHLADSRNAFVSGALRAAHWVRARSAGRYTMSQVLFG